MLRSSRIAHALQIGLPIGLAFISLIDPRAIGLAPVSGALSLLFLGRAWKNGDRLTPYAVASLLTVMLAITARSEPRWCCDATPYYIYLRSAAFDQDLDFRNDWARFGVESPEMTTTGRAINAHSVGPALLWTPFVLLAHVYVKALQVFQLDGWPADGFAIPYLRATAAGTVAMVTLGLFALWRTCARFHSMAVASAAVAFGCLTSTLPYYVFTAPSVAHGAVFAATALFLALWMDVEKKPTARGFIELGALLGVVSLMRWQAVVLGLMFVPLFVKVWRERTARWWWAPAAVLASVGVMLPQAIAWWVLFGSPLAAPTQAHGMDWSSPHFINVLFSADRGLFTWTPAMAIGCVGWLILARSQPAFAWSATAVFLATTWVNGGVAIWSGGDAFGGRRFDLIIPLWVLGFAAAIDLSVRLMKRHPLSAPVLALSVFVFWNFGLMRLHRNGVFTDAASFEEVAARQASLVRHTAEDWLGNIDGPRGRNFAYRAFVGRYFYLNTGFDGKIDLSLPTVQYLSGDWWEGQDGPNSSTFRFAAQVGSCIKIPLERPLALPVIVSARSVVDGQHMSLLVNGRSAGDLALPLEWTDLHFDVPSGFVNPGENLFCLAFSKVRANQRAAAVRLFQLP